MTVAPKQQHAGPPDHRGSRSRHQPRGHRLSKAVIGIPLLAASAWLGRAAKQIPHNLDLPPPVPGTHTSLETAFGRLAFYAADAVAVSGEPPLLLVHSINAAASAYEIKPIFERSRGRPVYALDLPGYGLSERRAELYTPRIMTDAILSAVDEVARRHGPGPIDALALSLSSEFLARAATERPAAFRSLSLISPTGFDKRSPRNGPPGSNRGMPKLYRGFTFGLWRRPFFDLLTSRVSIRYFLEKTFGSKQVDQSLIDYDYLTTHQPGAEHAPFSFISGFLFSNDISRIYDALRLPIWMVHGVRGDFQDYSGKRMVENRANWSIEVFQTGALPQFEIPDRFQDRFEAFLATLPAPATAIPQDRDGNLPAQQL
ncbi:alpha/beta hydrolase [Lichenifustis flavocetrariae]|uniref:Alpha/beta hydrolase n=1 Tax=Lichenifustis flavocetrariae TaxID=2949735 RepID=A0AA42CIV0_9HYPH|nr:alpha/beta hydrolase [Lichenifustis flavocetrariae]MCW6507276.1 alpha/beta hydrolase [Lichenifustis flavocetrariae]